MSYIVYALGNNKAHILHKNKIKPKKRVYKQNKKNEQE